MKKQSEIAAIMNAFVKGVITQRVAVRKLESYALAAYVNGRHDGSAPKPLPLPEGEPDTIFGEPVRDL